jgi:purine nucleosidase/pyrimidine-specific ribonucleoside hydrolase
MLEMLGKTSTPIYSGSSKPLVRELAHDYFFGEHGLGSISVVTLLEESVNEKNNTIKKQQSKINKRIKKSLSGNAVNKMLSIIKKNPQEVIVIALGPLTNIAQAIQKDPATMKLAKAIFITGGALFVPGNITKAAEFNFYVDPEAADIVLKSEVNKKLVSSDAVYETNYTWQELVDDLEQKPILKDPLTQQRITAKNFISKMLKFKNGQKVLSAALYDPLALYAASNNIATYDCQVTVDTAGEITRAQSSPDCKKEKNVTVVHKISKNSFKSYMLKNLQ